MISRVFNRSKDFLYALPWVENAAIDHLKGSVSCLLYHRIEPYGENSFLDSGGSPVTSSRDFEKELEYLKSLPTKFYTLQQLQNGDFPDSNTIGIVICFDDCFKCNYKAGILILEKHGIPAVFFQCSSFIESRDLIWEHKLYWLNCHHKAHKILQTRLRKIFTDLASEDQNLIENVREKLNPEKIEHILNLIVTELKLGTEISKIARHIYPEARHLKDAFSAGHEIASHGHNHYKRKSICMNQFINELAKSKNILAQITGQEPSSYSYPFNSYSESDHNLTSSIYTNIAIVEISRLEKPLGNDSNIIPRLTWPGISTHAMRMKRWILTGSF